MPPEGPTQPQSEQANKPVDKREHQGLAAKLKELLTGPRAETPAELAQRRAEDDVAMQAHQEARVQDLQQRADSGEVPVVPADQRYETGQTPTVSPAEPPETTQNPQ